MDERKLKRKKEKAIIEKNLEQLYHSCKELGDDYLRDEKNEYALKEYEEAERAARELDNQLYIAVTNRMIGETLCALGEFDKALEHQIIHLEYARKEGNLIEEQRALATLGRTYFVQAESFSDSENDERSKSLRLSRKYYLKSLKICENLPLSNQLGQKTLSEMKSRLFLNLGLTCEAEGNTVSGIEYISEAILICKNVELWEDLCRSYTAQGSIYYRQGITDKAILAYEKALRAAEHIEKKIQLTCELLSLKADVLIDLSDYNGAKNLLIRAYKMKTPDLKDKEEIKRKLKIIVQICKAEKLLLELPQSDYKVRKEINEKLGDLCVKLNDYKKAIQYYLSTRDCALAMKLRNEEVAPIYYSLSQTYKDNKEYQLSVEYSQKEYELIKDNYEEACQTLLNLSDTMELMKKPFDELMDSYEKCLQLAKKSGNLKIESNVLKNILRVQKEFKKEDLARETERELNVIKCCLPDTEEVTEHSDNDVSGDDIDLDELSDLSSDNDEDPLHREKRLRRRTAKSSVTRRNEKGETPLHVASAKGNVLLIRSLIKQGHPVNIPDAAGWSPLHEACNHGQIEAAKVLIELGANIDDRGGPSCDGITPLLDAASNGHLELITLLLDKGASPLAKTNQGDTVLGCLEACRERAIAQGEKLDYETQKYFESVVQRLKDCYDKVGQTYVHVSKKSSNTDTCTSRHNSSSIEKTRTKMQTQTMREKHSRDDCLSMAIENSRKQTTFEITKSNRVDNGAKEYKDAIEALRRRNKNDSVYNEPIEKTKKNALLHDDEVGDNWLEDDLENARRPAKRRRENFVGQQLRQPNKVQSTSSDAITKSAKSFSALPWDDDDDDLFAEVIIPMDTSKSRSPSPDFDFSRPSGKISRNEKKPARQKSLLSMNIKRIHTQNKNLEDGSPPRQVESKISSNTITQSFVCTVRSIKVRIENKLFLIPIPSSENEPTIGWLANEASRRYQNTEGVTPVLNLTTTDGALLDANDPVSLILNDSEICGTVLSWKLKPLNERYREACSAASLKVNSYLEQRLDACQTSTSLVLQDRRLSIKELTPVYKAIQHFHVLQHICLSSIFLKDHDFKALVDHISKLNQILSLNVSVNLITNDGLSHLAQVISSGSLKTIQELDVSYNPVGENCGSSLSTLSLQLVYLRSMNLKYVELSPNSFYGNWYFEFAVLESLDVSFNKLDREAMLKILSGLDPNRIRSLNFSFSGDSEVLREIILFLERSDLDNLEELYLAGLNIDDDDVLQLTQSLTQAKQLRKLDLSDNAQITFNSHQHLSELRYLKELYLSGCAPLSSSHQLPSSLSKLTLSCDTPLDGFYSGPFSFFTNTKEL